MTQFQQGGFPQQQGFGQPQQGFQQQGGGFPQQGGFQQAPQQQQPQGGEAQGGHDQGTITKIYENHRQGGSVQYAFILDGDKQRRYSTKYPPKGEGLQVQVQYKVMYGKRFVQKLDELGGAPQQGPQQQPQGGFQQAPQNVGQTAQQGAKPREGMQVGNALNNAAAILGPSTTLAQLEYTAFAILEIADRLSTGDTSQIQWPAPQGAQVGGFQQG